VGRRPNNVNTVSQHPVVPQVVHPYPERSGCVTQTASVDDTPVVELAVGKTKRRRHHAPGMWALLVSLDVRPASCVAFLETSSLMPMNGRMVRPLLELLVTG
jgi:hypothetical protein